MGFDLQFNIIKHLGTFTENNGWTKEVNIISWNNKGAKIDIRDWDPEHKPRKGKTFSLKEAMALGEILIQLDDGTLDVEDFNND